jgi:SiaC family regulatory phosphoprotein
VVFPTFFAPLRKRLEISQKHKTMDNIVLQPSPKTPSVNFDAQSGIIELKGRSIPENSLEFYRPLIEWVEKYAAASKAETNVHIQLEYFNTSSSKCLLDLFKRLETIGNKVVINWYYEQDDEDMLEAGEDYEAIINVPFKMIEVEEMK